jgi:hypothetical protein
MDFVQARNYTKGRISPIEVIVIHDMEYPERLDTAEAVAKWFAGSTAPRASTHYNMDSDTVVQSVYDSDTAWCAPGANANGLHFEHAGYAKQTRDQWLDEYGKKMIEISARLVAQKCLKYRIPVLRLSVTQLRNGEKGIVGHWDVSNAFHKSSHYDPGPNFPWDYYLSRVAFFANQTTPPPTPPPSTALTVDGKLGPKTISRWQTIMGTPVDGVLSRPSLLVTAVQRRLNSRGMTDNEGQTLALDGLGIQTNVDGRYPSVGTTDTIEALQRYLGIYPRDGYLSATSSTVMALQRRLNTGKF